MKIVRKYILLSVLMIPLMAFAQGKSDAPHSCWKVGDTWEVDVTLYSRDWMLYFGDPVEEESKDLEKVLGQYTVVVEVTAKVSHEGVDCWRIDFVPDEKAPEGVREQKYRILVSTMNGTIRDLSRIEGENVGNHEIEDVDGIPVLKNAPYGFPLEMIPWKPVHKKTKTKKSSPRRHKLSVERKETTVDGAREFTLDLKEGVKKLSSVRQKWGQGNRWWSEYQKHHRGHKELQAKLKTPSRK
jgi:hypothetical protein